VNMLAMNDDGRYEWFGLSRPTPSSRYWPARVLYVAFDHPRLDVVVCSGSTR
jgi:hypothetical protein